MEGGRLKVPGSIHSNVRAIAREEEGGGEGGDGGNIHVDIRTRRCMSYQANTVL